MIKDTTDNNKMTFAEDFIRRVKDNKPTRWIRFGLVSLIFFLWVAWMGSLSGGEKIKVDRKSVV